MFESAKVIVFITKSTVSAMRVSEKQANGIKDQVSYQRGDGSLLQIFQTIKKKFGDTVRIMVSDELSYVLTFTATSSSPSTEEIQARAQEVIPEHLSHTSWDYKVFQNYVEVAAISQLLNDEIQQTAAKSGLHIVAIEPESVSLARLIPSTPTGTLIVYQQDTSLLIAVVSGLVLSTASVAAALTPATILQFITFIKERSGVEIATIILSGAADLASATELSTYKIESKQLLSVNGLAAKDDMKASDRESLNIALKSPATVQVSTSSAHQPHTRMYIMLAALLLSFTTAGYFLYSTYFQPPAKTSRAKISAATPLPPTFTPTPTTASAEATIDRSSQQISILNGSGIPGEAGKLADYLQKEKFTIDRTGNADRDTYTQVLIKYNPKVSKGFVKELDKVLKTFYTDRNAQSEVASDEADITIIIGTPS